VAKGCKATGSSKDHRGLTIRKEDSSSHPPAPDTSIQVFFRNHVLSHCKHTLNLRLCASIIYCPPEVRRSKLCQRIQVTMYGSRTFHRSEDDLHRFASGLLVFPLARHCLGLKIEDE